MSLLRGDGFVLRIRDFAEADLIVTLFTERWGKRVAIAKGAKRLNSRLGGVFDLLNHVEVVFYEKPRLDLISQGTLLTGFSGLKENLDAVSAALRVGGLLDQLLPFHQREERIYSFFLHLLGILEQGSQPVNSLFLAAILKLLALLGHRPQLANCVRCGEATEKLMFSNARGGVVCTHCADTDGVTISCGLARALDSFLWLPLERVGRVSISEEDRALAQRILDAYVLSLTP